MDGQQFHKRKNADIEDSKSENEYEKEKIVATNAAELEIALAK